MEEKLGSSSATTTTANRSTKVCVYYNTPRGCAYGERCRYRHVLNNDGHSTRTQQQQQQQQQHKQHKHEQRQKSSKNTRSNHTYRPGGRQQRDGTISNERVKVSGGSLEEGDERRDAVLHREDNRFSASTSHRSTMRSPQSLGQPSSLSSTRSLERSKGGDITEEDREDGEMSHLHSLLQFPQIGSQSTNQYHHYQQPLVSGDGRNPSSGLTVASTSDTRQCKAANSRSRGNNTTRGQPRRGPSSEFSLGDLLFHSTTATTRQPVARPTAEKSDNLFSTEIQQMKLRFPDNNLELLEKSSVQHVYKIMFEPTDPDWPFSFGVLALKVTFPTSYPKELCTVVLAEDGEKILPQHCSKSINDAVNEELKRLSQSLGKSALIFRPFLRWFDRNIVELIRMSCSPKDLESLLPVPKTQHGNSSSDGKCPDGDDGRNSFDESGDESDDDHHSNDHHDNSNEAQLVSTCEGTVKRGTEVKVKNLTLTPEVGVVQCTEMKVVLLCGRCKESIDVRVKPLKVVNSTCPRCHLSISAHYRPSTVHLENTTLGFLDVDSCIVYDVVMFGSEVTVSCMTCGKNTCTKGLHYGQPHLLWCQHCHQKMIVTMETCRLMQHAPLDHSAQMSRPSESSQGREKRTKEVEIREGHPLPGRGTCEHYKKSFRWLRFPCCGKAFPCDVCHDTKEDHPYELANRMICGHCAKEQAYTSGKPCITCKSLLTSTSSTGFWEGGQGCRNKLKMNRNEKKKYSNSTGKTSSLKKERVGVKGKIKALHD